MKIADIRHVRNVPALQSSKVAALPGKLERLNVVADTVNRSGNILNEAIENESSMDANRRENEARRTYGEQVTTATQEFHSDPNSSAEAYAERLNDIRETSFANASEGASGRTMKYLRPRLDNMRTQVAPAEMELAIKAVQSKQYMHLQTQSELSAELVTKNGERLDEQFNVVKNEIAKMTTLSVQERKELENKTSVDLSKRAVVSMANDGDMAGLSAFLDSEMFYDMSLDQQEATRSMTLELAAQSLDEDSQVMRNKLARGEVVFNNARKYMAGQIANMPGITETGKKDAISKMESTLAKEYLSGKIARREYAGVKDAIDSGEFDNYLNPADTISLTSSAEQGLRVNEATRFNDVLSAAANAEYNNFNGNTGDTDAVLVRLDEILNSGDGTDAQRDRLQTAKEHLTISQRVQPFIKDAPLMTDAELSQFIADERVALTASYPKNAAQHVAASKQVISVLSAHAEMRTNDPASYAQEFDPEVKAAYGKVEQSFVESVTSTDPATRQESLELGNAAYIEYKAALSHALTRYDSVYVAPNTLPLPKTAMSASFAKMLNTQDRSTQLASIETMAEIFGSDAYSLVVNLAEESPALAGAAAAKLQNNDNLSRDFLRGNQIVKSKEFNITDGDIWEAVSDHSVLISSSSAPNYSDATFGMFRTLIAAYSTREDIQKGVLTKDVLLRAREGSYGEPGRATDYGGLVTPFRDQNTGNMVPIATIISRFKMVSEGRGGIGDPYFMSPEGPVKTSWDEVGRYYTPLLGATPGTYELDMHSATHAPWRGKLVDKLGNVLTVNIMSVPEWRPIKLGKAESL